MCGITGILDFGPSSQPDPQRAGTVRAMTAALGHRGPDGEGVCALPGLTLGQRRLAILDLSAAGGQPMSRGPLTLVYNGELYNHPDLRAALAGRHRFTTGTDTEVVLHAWLAWGPAALHRFDGMFAFAVHDARSQRLHLVRDRLGLKPLYYHHGARSLAFASEAQALLRCPDVPASPDLGTWYRHLLCSTTLAVDPTATLLNGIQALPPAGHLTVDRDGNATIRHYWTLPAEPRPADSPRDTVDELGALLHDTVTRMRTGDVPAAAFLSGGLDSATIAVLAADSGPPLPVFTLDHADPLDGSATERGEDLRHSRLLANAHPDRFLHRLTRDDGTLTVEDLDAVTDLATVCEDPRHPAILRNYRSVAAHGLKVVLNGQGADETMGGYLAQPAMTHLLDSTNPNPNPNHDPGADTVDQLLASRQAGHLTAQVARHRPAAHDAVRDLYASLPGPPLERVHRLLVATQVTRVVQFEDHLGMAAGVEARFPFLAHRLVEWCFTQPFTNHLEPHHENGSPRVGKALLRAAMAGRLPAPILRRPKQVFPHPDPARLGRALGLLADQHESAVRADPLVDHLYALPHGRLRDLPTGSLWRVLATWRWHNLLTATRADAATSVLSPLLRERTA